MIRLIDVVKGVLLCLVFVLVLRAIETRIELMRKKHKNFKKTSQVKYKIVWVTTATFLLVLVVYNFQCRNHPHGSIDLLECIYVNPGKDLARNVAIALYINTTLFLGGLHQELYNGRIRKKFMRFYKKQFQWNLFKKLFIVTNVLFQVIFRVLLCRIVDPNMNHPSFFTFLSGTLYAVSHAVNYFHVRNKFGNPFASKAIAIQVGYNLVFGLYISHIFSKSPALISSLVIQVYANFMGFPDYFEVLKGNMHDQRSRKTVLFYFCGLVGCLSCCLFL